MAGKRKKKRENRRRRLWPWLTLAGLTLAALFFGWMALQARIVYVRRAEVYLKDLPASLDGTTLLYVSDVDLCGINTPDRADRLFRRLESLRPDALLLGGGYASASLVDRLNGRSSGEEVEARAALFRALSDFAAPMGKYAICGPDDGDPEALRAALAGSGFVLADGTARTLAEGLVLAGVGATTDANAVAAGTRTDQCVIALAASPRQVVDVQVAEPAGGGAWADLILTGHTHGGQIRIGSRFALVMSDAEKRYRSGWYADGGAPVLVSQGMGCEAINLRLNTQSEVWLIALRQKL